MKPASKKFKLILAISFLFIFIFGIILASNTSLFSNQVNNVDVESIDISKLVLEKDGKPTNEFYDNLDTLEYSELASIAPNVVNQPNITDEELKSKISKQVKFNENPSNIIVNINSEGLDSYAVTISRGDYVTWKNNTNSEVMINGVDGWSSIVPIKPGESFTQLFDYVGGYEYGIDDVSYLGFIKVKNNL